MRVGCREDYTFKYNQKLGRHGWLRLTPAYSVKLVRALMHNVQDDTLLSIRLLDPFSGTATTGLVAAEEGLSAHLFEINPFLVWLGNVKCANYRMEDLKRARVDVEEIIEEYKEFMYDDNWIPSIYNINRWWSSHTLRILAALRRALVCRFGEPGLNIGGLFWIGFCRVVIETSAAAFNHVSMSFHNKVTAYEIEYVDGLFRMIMEAILTSALQPLRGTAQVFEVDSRKVRGVDGVRYTYVITSPPYPNRISYIRELRPYMYWTRFLEDARTAGEIDWKAIGGTWGIATSRLRKWRPHFQEIPEEVYVVSESIRNVDNKSAELMGTYVLRYFHDMHAHFASLRDVLMPGARLFYIVGNSTFYGIRVDTEKLLARSLESLGYREIKYEVVRKRNTKKELFEYCLTATWG